MGVFKSKIFVILFLEVLTSNQVISEYKFGRHCYICSSHFTSKCVTDPRNMRPVPCKHTDDLCAVAIRGTETIRGCNSEITKTPDLKETCNKSKCNDYSFPNGRLFCHQCKACTMPPKSLPKICAIYKKNDECYTDVLDNGETNRGCKSDLQKFNKYTQFCPKNGCNNQPGIRTLSCISCKTSNDTHCGKVGLSNECYIDSQQFCQQTALLGRENVCFTYRKFDYVDRGCIGNGEMPIKDREFYEFCNSSNNCNNKCSKPIKCIKCDSEDKHCNGASVAIKSEICLKTSSCHVCKTSNNRIIRGCGAPINPKMFDRCHYCQGSDGCNTQNLLTCYKCDSRTDKNCAQWTNPERITQEICANVRAECGVKIQGVNTIRGCFLPEEFECRDGDIKCLRCNKYLCNTGIVPNNRKKCHICSKTKECAQAQAPENAVVCPNYQENDQCIFYADTSNEIIRTCSSDLDEFNKCNESEPFRCQICQGDGCNETPLMLEPTLSCVKCKGEKCAWGQRNDRSSKCVNKFPYYLPESCITQLVDGEIERGCTLDLGACSDTECRICYTNACNIQSRISQECFQCNSSRLNETSCAEAAEEIGAHTCRYPSITYDQRGCYTKRYEKFVIRGCAADLTAKELANCKEDVLCHFCEDKGCNRENAPNSTYSTAALSNVFIALLITANFLFYHIIY